MGYGDKNFSPRSGGNGYGGRQGGYGGGQGGRSGSYGGQGGFVSKPATFPNGYLSTAYLDTDGKRDVRYITRFAEDIGKTLGRDNNTGKSKIRAYFDTVNSINEAFCSGMISQDTAIIRLAQLKPRVADRLAKGNASQFFVDFINKNIDTVIEDEEFFKERLMQFRDHFEAVVCYTADKKERR